MPRRPAGRCVGHPHPHLRSLARPSPLDLEVQGTIPPRPAAASQPAAPLSTSGRCGVASAPPSTSGRCGVASAPPSTSGRCGVASAPLSTSGRCGVASAPPSTSGRCGVASAPPSTSGRYGVASAAPSTPGSRAPVSARIASQARRAGGGGRDLGVSPLASSGGRGFGGFSASHPSSLLLGVFVDKNEHVPRFYTGIPSSNPVIDTAVCSTDTALTRLDRPLPRCLRDCRKGRLLLTGSDGSMCIYDPLSQRRVPIGPRKDLEHGWKCLGDCLLELDDGLARHTVLVEQSGQQVQAQESFRVISLQLQSHSRFNVRAVEYNSGTLQWRVAHPQTGWTKVQVTKLELKAMYAAGHIFWQTDAARLLVLDTSTMEFSEHAVPGVMVSTSWAIGELGDGKGCLVRLQGGTTPFREDAIIVEDPLCLEVWTLEKKAKEGADKFCWKWDKDALVSEMLLGERDARVYRVHRVMNGLALIGCHDGSYAIDLQSMTLLARFESGGDVVYPYQMSATGVVSTHLGANLSNEEGAQIPSNNYTDGREGTSSGGSESASLQSQLHVESPDVGGSSDIEDASCDDDNQHALASLGIGDADATIVPAISAVNSHANEEETGGWASDGRTMLTKMHEKVAQEIHSSQTPLNSEQHDIGEKSSQDLHGGSARSQPMETDPCHDELTLQTAGVFPSESCDGSILEDKSETGNLPKNTTEDTEMLEQQNSDKDHIKVSCADKMSEVLYDDNNTLEKNTISDEMATAECYLALSRNGSSETRSNAISSPMQKRLCTNNLPRHSWEVYERKKRSARRFTGCSEEFSSKHKKKIHEESSAHVKLSTDRIKCVRTSPADGPEAHEETRPAQVGGRRTSNRERKRNKLISGDDWVVGEGQFKKLTLLPGSKSSKINHGS